MFQVKLVRISTARAKARGRIELNCICIKVNNRNEKLLILELQSKSRNKVFADPVLKGTGRFFGMQIRLFIFLIPVC
jgi:hypothetical protein